MNCYDVYIRLQELRIALPPLGAPAAYTMASQSGSLVHLSGHIAKRDGAV